jgi:phosphonate transport system substrate-binding protein
MKWHRVVALVVIFGLASTAAAAVEAPLVLGVLPRDNYADTLQTFGPLARQLGQSLGREVRLETTKDFAGFWQAVRARRYDLVYYNQYHYLKSHKESGYQLLLKNEEFGSARIAAVILVRKDRGIADLRELKGQTIAFGGDNTAMMSYIVPTAMLRTAGLRRGDYTETFARNPLNALMAVYYGQAAACGVGDVIPRLAELKEKIDIGQLAVLATSAALPHLPWAVRGDMPAALQARIRAALVGLKDREAGRQVLARAQLTALVPAEDAEYEPLRRIVQQVREERL